ncbi:hypothetical protein [Desulfuribacillus alkaliarsenatis]|uniref:Uncharacterized protein n=1 Tax=Desulfuribacillus alkaliarsenatis TaxID=766136 RepID=A0A1E5FYP4_9FIRM|nr:hypothetical protein [Desulfuribacillus alkaliarsenatis]OEF95689.1 hypothetical protein BHF68_11320 [Desulfuribacillus alkaliarsenatis]
MKKGLLLIAVLVFSLAILGCNAKIQEEEPVVAPNEEKPAAELSIDEVQEAYYKAVEAYGWFDMTTMPVDSTMKEIDGMIYNRVDHSSIKTYADLEEYLHSLFASDIVDRLLDPSFKRYRDIDGELYGILADRGSDIFKGDETLEIEKENDTKFVCIVEVELLDEDFKVTDYEAHEFAYELVDGQWVFTNFYMVR